MRKAYHPNLFTTVPWHQVLDADGDFPALVNAALTARGTVDRVCVDRWLAIHECLRSAAIADPTVLDLGCSSGIFSVLMRLAMAREVTAVDDGSALSAGYGSESVLEGMEASIRTIGLRGVLPVRSKVESFVASAAASGQRWDVVLCMGLLHHLLRGYGDRMEHAPLSSADFDRFLEELGTCVGLCLWLEVDETRVGDPEAFYARVQQQTGLPHLLIAALTCSGPGRPRRLMCLSRTPMRGSA